MAPIPGLLETWDTLKTVTPSQDTEILASMLRARCYEIGTQVEKWQHDLATAGPSFTPEEASALRTQINALALEDLPDGLITYGPWYLFTWMMHWATCLVLY